EPVDMAELKVRAGARVAGLIGAPAAVIVASAAAGIAQSAAAVIVGHDPVAIESVPDVRTARREIVLQKSHAVHFGAPIIQMLRLGGGIPVEAGSSNRCSDDQLAASIGPA